MIRLQTQRSPGLAGLQGRTHNTFGNSTSGGADLLLSRLESVRNAGKGWRARCPACGGQSQKVSITEADNGSILLHAFCGCSPADVLGAVGLQLGDLFPRRLAPMNDAERRASRRVMKEAGWSAALGVLAREATVALIAARQLSRWQCLSEEDDARLAVACDRIDQARGMLT